MKFNEFDLNNNVFEAIADLGYQEATPIQEKAMPILLKGNDLVGCAQTGTGKTAAFAIPIINHIHRIVGSGKKRKQIRTVILTPTRELAVQIAKNFEDLSKYTQIKTYVIYGGVDLMPQISALKEGVDVLVATPGRFLDLYKQNKINIDAMHQLVIDEADLMLDMGFINDVRKIIKLTPSNRQTLMFSATMPMGVRELADEFLSNAAYVSVDPISSAAENVTQKMYQVEKEDKKKLLKHIVENEKLNNVLIFTRTKHGADNVAEFLQKEGYKADAIHGDKSQSARLQTLNRFKEKELDFLVATDVASRGIDIQQLPFVINYDIPNIPEVYIHRIGRTGRAGLEGLSISFVGRDEKTYFQDIEKLMKTQVKIVKDNPFPWREPSEHAKKDFRKKSNNNQKSRKSDSSKKNKKRWY
ncbi:DEAD/DEAH box helicase [Flavobacterium sp. xlx-214]|uniref:DEAD/DEAH box helicase n=1 Tax=unclassified Flavobacterium TaxID=196869 RepID=UPI0013D09399|nr:MULTISPECIES: DEAD/DEAH box helicase [unclassified Flavobacterium]MBA5791610.1 DEAD/DEAH box helicase [Flavobacterium sp. xlx-221]QMI82856.1 DEAD/DEAH box helicase [Flavobacterium sp. xlx-214]